MDEAWVKVAEAGDAMELELWRALLAEAGVPLQARAVGLRAMQGALGGAASLSGAFELRVPQALADFARELLTADPLLPPEAEAKNVEGDGSGLAGDS